MFMFVSALKKVSACMPTYVIKSQDQKQVRVCQTNLFTGSKSMATACRRPETGITTSVRSGVSSEIRRISTLRANNRKCTGPVTK